MEQAVKSMKNMAPRDAEWHLAYAKARAITFRMFSALREHPAFEDANAGDLGDAVDLVMTQVTFLPRTRDDFEATADKAIDEMLGNSYRHCPIIGINPQEV